MLIQKISSFPKPILLLDTCSILDILRTPYREKTPIKIVRELPNILDSLRSNTVDLYVIVSDQVLSEWNDNQENVVKELEKHLKQLNRNMRSVSDVVKAVNVNFTPSYFDVSELAKQLQQLAEMLLTHSIKLDGSDQFSQLAVKRVTRNIPPSHKGGQVKDCLILEHYLSLCKQLRNAGFQQKLILVTSNTKDYGSPEAPKYPLGKEFQELDLKYVTDIAWAWHLVKQV